MNETMNELLGTPSSQVQSLFDLNAAQTLAVTVWRNVGGAIMGAALVMGSAEWIRYEVNPSNGAWLTSGTCTPPDDANIFVSLDGVAAMQAAAYLGVSE